MRCGRCGYAVPEWLWIGDDHPIIVEQKPTVIRRTDHEVDNTMHIVAETVVKIQMCKDVNHLQDAEKIDFKDPYARRVLSVGLMTLLRQHGPQDQTVRELVDNCPDLSLDERWVVSEYLKSDKLVKDL